MKQAKIFQKLAVVLFGLFLFVPYSCGMIQDTTASININLGGGARAVSAEDKAAAVFDIYFNGELVGSRVSGNFHSEVTMGTTVVVRVEAFLDGKLIATGESSLYVQRGVNSITVTLREVETPSDGGGGAMPTQITIAVFDTSKFCKQGDNSIGNFSSGDAAGISIQNVDAILQTTIFNEGEQLPEPTFTQGDTHTATFVGWVPVDETSLLSKTALNEFNGKTLIPGILLEPISVPFDAEIVGGQQYPDFMTAFNAVTADQTLKLLKDVNITSQLSITKNMTLDLNGYSISGDDTFGLIDIQARITFTLNDSKGSGSEGTLTGGGNYGNGSAVYINNNATFKMYGGNITGNQTNTGGAVYVYGGTFEMHGGKITNNTVTNPGSTGGGGGVRIDNNGSFIMETGEISNNTVSGTTNGKGGGIFVNGGTFTKTGGEVKNNSAPNGKNLYVASGSTATGNGATLATTNDAF